MKTLFYILLITQRLERLFQVPEVLGKFAGAKPVQGNGGVRVIYFNSSQKEIWLLTMYVKNERENIPAQELKKIREAING